MLKGIWYGFQGLSSYKALPLFHLTTEVVPNVFKTEPRKETKAMCVVCGMMFCPPSCPEYDERKDPSFNGYCRGCDVAMYHHETDYCDDCREEIKREEGGI